MKSIIYRNWPMHNIIAHPLMEIFSWFGFKTLGDKIHDTTLPIQ